MLAASVICTVTSDGGPAVHLAFDGLDMLNATHAPLLLASMERIAKLMIDSGAIQRYAAVSVGDWLNAGRPVR